jgi:hypothetical protein
MRRRPPRETDVTLEQRAGMVEDYLTGKSLSQLAGKYGYSKRACYNSLKRAGLRPRTPIEAYRISRLNKLLPPLPQGFDAEGFGHWLSGLVDGEGCFGLAWKPPSRNERPTPRAWFIISLRLDDFPTLRVIQSYWRCGTLAVQRKKSTRDHYTRKPSGIFSVQAIGDVANTVVPHFERYPLRAKKAADFAIWKESVRLLYAASLRPQQMQDRRKASRHTEEELARFRDLHDALRATRRYAEPPDLD